MELHHLHRFLLMHVCTTYCGCATTKSFISSLADVALVISEDSDVNG